MIKTEAMRISINHFPGKEQQLEKSGLSDCNDKFGPIPPPANYACPGRHVRTQAQIPGPVLSRQFRRYGRQQV